MYTLYPCIPDDAPVSFQTRAVAANAEAVSAARSEPGFLVDMEKHGRCVSIFSGRVQKALSNVLSPTLNYNQLRNRS